MLEKFKGTVDATEDNEYSPWHRWEGRAVREFAMKSARKRLFRVGCENMVCEEGMRCTGSRSTDNSWFMIGPLELVVLLYNISKEIGERAERREIRRGGEQEKDKEFLSGDILIEEVMLRLIDIQLS